MYRFMSMVSSSSRKPLARSDAMVDSFSSRRVSQMSSSVASRSLVRMWSSAFTSATSRMSRGTALYACWKMATNSCLASGRVRNSANSTRRACRYASSPSWISRISEKDRASEAVYCSSAIFQMPSSASASCGSIGRVSEGYEYPGSPGATSPASAAAASASAQAFSSDWMKASRSAPSGSSSSGPPLPLPFFFGLDFFLPLPPAAASASSALRLASASLAAASASASSSVCSAASASSWAAKSPSTSSNTPAASSSSKMSSSAACSAARSSVSATSSSSASRLSACALGSSPPSNERYTPNLVYHSRSPAEVFCQLSSAKWRWASVSYSPETGSRRSYSPSTRSRSSASWVSVEASAGTWSASGTAGGLGHPRPSRWYSVPVSGSTRRPSARRMQCSSGTSKSMRASSSDFTVSAGRCCSSSATGASDDMPWYGSGKSSSYPTARFSSSRASSAVDGKPSSTQPLVASTCLIASRMSVMTSSVSAAPPDASLSVSRRPTCARTDSGGGRGTGGTGRDDANIPTVDGNEVDSPG
mmetsp:Transcript_27258/g.81661  ORF Transcript_27258/g.81661 Transcript_27258/m.81661 type:complete len:534 (+) Transcript_27258:468-2069(+)